MADHIQRGIDMLDQMMARDTTTAAAGEGAPVLADCVFHYVVLALPLGMDRRLPALEHPNLQSRLVLWLLPEYLPAHLMTITRCIFCDMQYHSVSTNL